MNGLLEEGRSQNHNLNIGSPHSHQNLYMLSLAIFRGRKMWGPLMALAMMAGLVLGQNRRPTISFITQPEIVADIGGDVSCRKFLTIRFKDLSLGRNF